MQEPREVLIAHARTRSTVTHVRSTLIQSSLSFLRDRGHYAEYLRCVDQQHRATIVESLAPVWLPIEVALAHYAACDGLPLTASERVAIGEAVGDRIQGPFMETITRAARVAGVTPWTLLKRFDRLWERLMMGGSIQVEKHGPKDLQLEIRECPLLQYAYFRTGFTGVVRAGFKVVGVRASYVHEGVYDPDRVWTMRGSWV